MTQEKYGLIIKTNSGGSKQYVGIVGEDDYLQRNAPLDSGSEHFVSLNPVSESVKGEEMMNPRRFERIECVAIPFLLNLKGRRKYKEQHADAELRKDKSEIHKWCRATLEGFHHSKVIIRDAGDAVYCMIYLVNPVIDEKEDFIEKFHGFQKWLLSKYLLTPSKYYSISNNLAWSVRLKESRTLDIFGIPKTKEEVFLTQGGNDFNRFIFEEQAIRQKDEVEEEIEAYNNSIEIETVIKKMAPDSYIRRRVDSTDREIIWIPCPILYCRTGTLEKEAGFCIDPEANEFRDEHSAETGKPLDLINTLIYYQDGGKSDADTVQYLTKAAFSENFKRIRDVLQGETSGVQGVHERKDGYYRKTSRGSWSRITNFVMRVVKKIVIKDSEEMIREIRVDNGIDAKTFAIDSKAMGDISKFKARMQSIGDFFFWGSSVDLTKIFQYISHNDRGVVVIGLRHYGYFIHDKKNYYITNNVLISKHGFATVGRDGVFRVEGEKFCLAMEASLPYSVPPIDMQYLPKKNNEVEGLLDLLLNKIPESRGEKAFILAFGWLFAAPFAGMIRHTCDYRFPFLFLNGMTNEGKSKMGELMTYFSGFTPHNGIDVQDTSATTFKQITTAYNSFPALFDQFELGGLFPEKRREYEDMLKGLYDGSFSYKGSPGGRMRNVIPENACVCMCGEEMAQAAASRNRTVQVHMVKRLQNRDVLLYNDILDHQDQYSLLFSHYIQWMFKNPQLKNTVENLRGHSKTLTARTQGNAADRENKNYSIIVWGQKNLLDFALSMGVITRAERDSRMQKVWDVASKAFLEQMESGPAIESWR